MRATTTSTSLAALIMCASSCGGDGTSIGPDAAEPDAALPEVDTSTPEAEDATPAEAEAPPPCQPGLAPGSDGTRRGELAADFTIALAAGGELRLAEAFTGCESFVVVTDLIPVSAADPTSIWERAGDLAALIDGSPFDTHYLFVSLADAELAPARIAAMQARVDAAVAALDPELSDHWRAHLHVAAMRAQDLDAEGVWIGRALTGSLIGGLVIGHDQRLRALGNLSDVHRYVPALAGGEAWPWENNLAYARHEAWYEQAQAATRARMRAERASVIEVFGGEVLSEFADAEITLPEAAALAAFDTLEVEVTLRCPDPDVDEFTSCGAWDYLATLSLLDDDGASRELARFITPYHREAHWVADITPALAFFDGGGTRRLRWSFAPSWNPQPTATTMTLRFVDRQKGVRPLSTQLLFRGGPFGPAYNDRAPQVIDIPPATARAEVWSLVTGHGQSDVNGCAEFCAHSHAITVGDATHYKTFLEAGDRDACVDTVTRPALATTPNQAGTWWLGRGGWCPGAAVEPWVIDVSGDVVPGEAATFRYEAGLGGQLPPEGSGEIVMTSYLVLYTVVSDP